MNAGEPDLIPGSPREQQGLQLYLDVIPPRARCRPSYLVEIHCTVSTPTPPPAFR
jgi:hypothetical protein